MERRRLQSPLDRSPFATSKRTAEFGVISRPIF
jgi:hypothetical protein